MYESKRDARFQSLAYLWLRSYVRRHRKPFLAENFRHWLETNRPNVEPHDWRSLGIVFRWARDNGLIRRVGSAPAKTSHGNYKPKWVGCRQGSV